VGSKIVPVLAVVDLEELAQDGGVHPILREQAATLLGLPRPRRPAAKIDESATRS
jgi:hypothetical protein